MGGFRRKRKKAVFESHGFSCTQHSCIEHRREESWSELGNEQKSWHAFFSRQIKHWILSAYPFHFLQIKEKEKSQPHLQWFSCSPKNLYFCFQNDVTTGQNCAALSTWLTWACSCSSFSLSSKASSYWTLARASAVLFITLAASRRTSSSLMVGLNLTCTRHFCGVQKKSTYLYNLTEACLSSRAERKTKLSSCTGVEARAVNFREPRLCWSAKYTCLQKHVSYLPWIHSSYCWRHCDWRVVWNNEFKRGWSHWRNIT